MAHFFWNQQTKDSTASFSKIDQTWQINIEYHKSLAITDMAKVITKYANWKYCYSFGSSLGLWGGLSLSPHAKRIKTMTIANGLMDKE